MFTLLWFFQFIVKNKEIKAYKIRIEFNDIILITYSENIVQIRINKEKKNIRNTLFFIPFGTFLFSRWKWIKSMNQFYPKTDHK